MAFHSGFFYLKCTMNKKQKSRMFQHHIFISLLITGIFQVILISIFMGAFSSRLIEDAYTGQSNKKILFLTDSLNKTIQQNTESAQKLSKTTNVIDALFNKIPAEREEISSLYKTMYKSIAGRIDDVSLHLINKDGTRTYSTHILPAIYDPQSTEQEIKNFIRQNNNDNNFAVVSSLISPKGDKVALSLIKTINNNMGESGYIITDINYESLLQEIEEINISFFSDIFLIDNINHKYVNLLNKGEYGNFSEIQRQIPKTESGIFKSGGKLISYKTLSKANLVIVGTVEYEIANTNMLSLVKIIIYISLIGLLISALVAYILAKKISKPVIVLSEAMKKIEKGDLSIQVEYYNKDEFELLFHGFNKMSSQIRGLLDARIEREKALHTAERKALQSQINPHFLYNTLNTVKAISKLKNVPEITTIITELGKLLRDSIDSGDEFTTIKESIALVEGYLKIQRYRYGKNFKWSINIDPELESIIIPKLIIQPIVENSVIHGLENLTGDKIISISSISNPPTIVVSDNGVGIKDKDWHMAINGHNGVGIMNVNMRLLLYYGSSAGLTYSRENNMSNVKIKLSQNGDLIDHA